MKKIIILSQAPLTPQIKRNTYIDEYKSAGFEVEFWDLSQYMHPGMKYNDELWEIGVRNIFSQGDLKKFLQNMIIKDYIFILDFDPFWENRHIFRILSQAGCIFVRFDAYANTSLSINWLQKLSKLFSSRFLQILKTKMGLLGYKVYQKYYNISPFYRYYSSSSMVNCTEKINHPDYEEYTFTETTNLVNKPYILFVDTYFGYHPDDIYLMKYKKIPQAEEYQKTLRQFFTYLEQKYDMPVVIAAHPKSDYRQGEFGQRQVIKYQTKNLIAWADLVILQLCNTISYVALANKPVALVTTRDYDMLVLQKKALRLLAKTMGLKLYNLDEIPYENVEFSEISESLRKEYIYSYLTDTRIEGKKNIEILKDSFELIG